MSTPNTHEWAEKYIELGWGLCLLAPGQKTPFQRNWNTPSKIIDTVDKARAALASHPACGIGLVHAPSRTCTLDVDHLDYTREAFAAFGIDLDAVLASGPRILSKSGRAKVLFRLPDDFAPAHSKLALRWPDENGQMHTVFELRGGVNQDVLPPSIHPDTKKPYEWAAGQSPWDFDTIPLPDSRLLTIWQEWDRFGPQFESACPHRKTPVPMPVSAPPSRSSGHDGLIQEYNSQTPIEQQLLKYGYIPCGDRWMAPTSKTKLPGVVLLDGKMYSHHASDPLADGHAHDSFDVFTMLEHGGNVKAALASIRPPAPKVDLSGVLSKIGHTKQQQHESLIELAHNQPPEVTVKDAKPLVIKPMPNAAMNALAAWFDASFEDTHPLVSQAAALICACTAAGRRYVSPYGDPASALFCLLTPPGAMARYASQGVQQVLVASGLRHQLRATRLSAPQQLYALMQARPSCLYIADDFGDQVRMGRRQPSGLLEQALSLICTTFATGKDVLLDNWAEISLINKQGDTDATGETYPTIRSPALSFLGTVAGFQANKLFGPMELARGSIDYTLYIPTQADEWESRPLIKSPALPPAEAITRLAALAGIDPGAVLTAEDLAGANGLLDPTPRIARFAADVAKAETALLDQYRQRGPLARGLLSGARKTLRRLCTAIAAFENPQQPVVDERIVLFAAHFVGQCLDRAVFTAELKAGDDTDRPDAYQQVLEKIGEAGHSGIRRRVLQQTCWAYKALGAEARAELMERLIEDKAVVMRLGRRKDEVTYLHASFCNPDSEPSVEGSGPLH